MSYRLIVKDTASDEIEEAYSYYEEQSSGLGDRFVEEVEDKLNYVLKYPLHFQVTIDKFRQTLLRRFPFIIVYEVTDTSRDPETKFP